MMKHSYNSYPRKQKVCKKDRELKYVKLESLDGETIRLVEVFDACKQGIPEQAQTLLATIVGAPNFMLGGAVLLLGYVKLRWLTDCVNSCLRSQHVPVRMTVITTGNSRRNY